MSRFYRALLWLYPASFRAEYGDEMAAAFAARVASRSSVGAWAAAVADILPNAVAVHGDVLAQDVRYAARALRRTPAFAITATLVVALGVGANAAAFSIADLVLVRPLPFNRPAQLVKIWELTPGYSRMEPSGANYRDWKRMAASFAAMGAYTTNAVNLVGAGEPRRINVALVTFDVMPLLGVHAIAGRTIAPADSDHDRAVVLSHALWEDEFGGAPDVIGRRVDLDGKPSVVVGVMPSSFAFPDRDVDAWVSLPLTDEWLGDRNDNDLDVVARLRPGVTLDRARADMRLVVARLKQQYPKELENHGVSVIGLTDELGPTARALLVTLCGATLCILLLACANLASLLLARAITREREIAVRAALGAGRERLVRQLFTEGLFLIALGGAAGVGVARLALPSLAHLIPNSLPTGEGLGLDWRVLALALATTTLTSLAFGVLPAVSGGAVRTFDALRAGARVGGGRARVRGALVAIELSASVILLYSSGLLVRTMLRLQAVDPGFRVAGVVTMRTALPAPKYAATARRVEFYRRVLDGVRAIPGVRDAAYISFLPMTMTGGIWPVGITGASTIRDASNSASLRFVTPGFFSTLGIPIVRGRDVAETDDTTSTFVAVVSESFAKRYWPGQDPIGKRFTFAFRERMIAGVVRDIRVRGLEQTSEPQVYVPYRQVLSGYFTFYAPKDLVIWTTSSATSVVPDVRRLVKAIDPDQPVSNVQTMEEVIGAQTAARATQLGVLGVLALVALLLAGVGVYGLLSFVVSSRLQEIGVRLALGARSATIVRMVLREGIALTLAGVLPGAALAYAAGRAMQSLLVGVTPGDGLTMAAVITACAATTIIGCVRPARRASLVDPMAALRPE